jgi:hypothetical protein
MKFRKKPVVIEAEQWEGKFTEHDFLSIVRKDVFSHEGGCNCEGCGKPLDVHGVVKTLEGKRIVCPGDWIIKGVKGVKGEFYPCKPDIFEATYEPA